MTDTPPAPEFMTLWPTTIMRHRLPGSADANTILAEIVEDLDAGSADMTTDYLANNILEHEHPVLAWLKSCFDRAVTDYARNAGIDYELDWTIQAWANLNRMGDYHNLHNHPHAWLSGTYYVAVPETPLDLPGRADRTPGAISFFDPRPQANMNAINKDGQVDPEYRVQPKAGEILLWPAFLHHAVHPNLSENERISVSFNVVLRQHEQYLPTQ